MHNYEIITVKPSPWILHYGACWSAAHTFALACASVYGGRGRGTRNLWHTGLYLKVSSRFLSRCRWDKVRQHVSRFELRILIYTIENRRLPSVRSAKFLYYDGIEIAIMSWDRRQWIRNINWIFMLQLKSL